LQILTRTLNLMGMMQAPRTRWLLFYLTVGLVMSR